MITAGTIFNMILTAGAFSKPAYIAFKSKRKKMTGVSGAFGT